MKKLIKKAISVLVVCVIILNLSSCARIEKSIVNADVVRASVIEIEKYGHAVLDITAAEFIDIGYELGDIVCVRFGSFEEDMPFFDGYYSNPGAAMLRGIAPEENVAVCINYGDFSVETGIAPGDIVEITMAEKAGMLALQELCSLQYSNDRADYPDDVTFSNFRAVAIGRIGNGKLYRTASPINNENGRAVYANDLIASVDVAAVLNLADSIEDIEAYCEAEDFASVYYRDLYEAGNVMALDLTANFYSDEFARSVADGLSFLAHSEPPYCVHCTEGKDRAGFTIMLLAALMGAELDEIIDDYMLSFYNYYGIDKKTEPERYEAVLNNNLLAMLYHVTGVNTYEELVQSDLESAATKYLFDAGMTENDILTLKENEFFMTDHSYYMNSDKTVPLVLLTPSGMAEMKDVFANEHKVNVFSTNLLNDIITSVTEKDGCIIMTSVSDQEEIDSIEGLVSCEEELCLMQKRMIDFCKEYFPLRR